MRKSHHDREHIRDLIKQREDEGLTLKELAERSGIPAHVFCYRAKQDRMMAGLAAPPESGFVEVVAKHSIGQSEEPSGIELLLAGGVRAQLARNFDKDTLARLLGIMAC
ncbi:MAG: hypothetical protein ACI9F9_003168 [Candidatus Paceibacteria bacterium]|jgi:hypothetical protein